MDDEAKFTIFDKDIGRDDVVGEAMVTLGQLILEPDAWWDVVRHNTKTGRKSLFSREPMVKHGLIHLQTAWVGNPPTEAIFPEDKMFTPFTGSLAVTFVKASGLRDVEMWGGGAMDVYIKVGRRGCVT